MEQGVLGVLLNHGPCVGVVGIVAFFLGFDQILALDTQPHDQGRADKDGRVNAKHDANRQRQRKVVQAGATEEEHAPFFWKNCIIGLCQDR